MLIPPQEYTPSLSHSPSAATPPFQGFNNRTDKNSQSSVAITGLPLGELTSSTNSLTWREFLRGLTTCFFNPSPQHMGKGDGNNRNWMWGMVMEE
jgi:hypothetical protein